MTERTQASNSKPRVVDATDPSLGDEQLCELLEEPGRALREGSLVAFPTETVYGLGANALNKEAVRRIFEVKERPANHPLIVHVSDSQMARRCAAQWSSVADRLAGAFWPGPLTLIVPKSDDIPDVVTGGLSTVGCRLPSHPVARALIRSAGVPVAAPSANPHTEVSPTSAEHVLRGLGDRLDWVVDGGTTDVGIESTVVDVTGDTPTVLRPGAIGGDQLRSVLADDTEGIEFEDGPPQPEQQPRRSPGLAETHYAPEGEVLIGGRSALREIREQLGRGAKVGWMFIGTDGAADSPGGYEGDNRHRMSETPSEYARQLYAVLHQLNDAGCDYILIEEVPDGSEWRAIRDRLTRAASRRV